MKQKCRDISIKSQVINNSSKSAVYDKMQGRSNLHLFVGSEGDENENRICKSEHGAAGSGKAA